MPCESLGRTTNSSTRRLPYRSVSLSSQPFEIEIMKSYSSFFCGAATATLLMGCAASYALSHPNFQNAVDSIQVAINHVRGAQQVNGPTFGGHAGRAQQLLQEARTELGIADEYHRGVRY